MWAREFDADLIIPNLYLGSECAVLEPLKSRKITHILSVVPSKPAFPHNFLYMVIDVQDASTTNLITYFDKTKEFINEGLKKGVVFVHCAAGIPSH